MTETIRSANGVTIRLTDERWSHIIEEHSELAGMRLDVLEAVALPQRVFKGGNDELLAVREREPGKFLVAVYKELPDDGFVVTAFLTRRIGSIERRDLVWSAPK